MKEGGVLETFIYSFLTHVFFFKSLLFLPLFSKIFSRIFLVIYMPVGTFLSPFFL
jgi:hypothetical protein